MECWLSTLAMRRYELDLESEMRTFFRRYYTHSRYISATATALDSLQVGVHF